MECSCGDLLRGAYYYPHKPSSVLSQTSSVLTPTKVKSTTKRFIGAQRGRPNAAQSCRVG